MEGISPKNAFRHLSGNGIVGSFDFIADSLLTALQNDSLLLAV